MVTTSMRRPDVRSTLLANWQPAPDPETGGRHVVGRTLEQVGESIARDRKSRDRLMKASP